MQKVKEEQGKSGATRIENAGRAAGRKSEGSGDPLVGAVMTGKSGRYSIMEPLDAGGMGKVYTALDESQNTVVVKVISPNFIKRSNDDSEKIVERFFREARAAAMVSHENVIRIIDVGSYKEDVFCAMEYLKGKNLEDMVKKHRPSWEWLAPVMMDVCNGVDAAHRRGIIHRDLSPDNIFLAEVEGRRVVKVLDFGLAKFTQGEDDGLTKTGFAMGKITYMSPEQAEKACGQRSDYDHRVDIYAMGVIMYKLLTGVAPFKGENEAESLFMRLNVKPMRPREINPDIPPDAEAVIMKAMARHDVERYQSVAELKAAIAATRPNMPAKAAPESDDMFLGDILKSMERSDPSAPKRANQANVFLPEEAQEPELPRPAHAPQKSRWFGKLLKWTVALGIAAAAAYGIYRYRNDISNYFHDVRARATSTAPSSSVPAPEAGPSGLQVAGGFLATMNSVPSGAAVYEIKEGRRLYLGITPLSYRFSDEAEHTLSFSKRGFSQKRIKVSPARPVSNVSLERAGRPQAPSPDPEPEQGGGQLPSEGEGGGETPVE